MTEPCAQPSTELRELLEAVWRRIDRDELARLTQELVRIPSVYHPEEAEVPIVTPGAGEREVPHHRDEWVSVDKLLRSVR